MIIKKELNNQLPDEIKTKQYPEN